MSEANTFLHRKVAGGKFSILNSVRSLKIALGAAEFLKITLPCLDSLPTNAKKAASRAAFL